MQATNLQHLDRSKEGTDAFIAKCLELIQQQFPIDSKVLAPINRALKTGESPAKQTAAKPHEVAIVKEVRRTGHYIRVDIEFVDGYAYGAMTNTVLALKPEHARDRKTTEWNLEYALKELGLVAYPY